MDISESNTPIWLYEEGLSSLSNVNISKLYKQASVWLCNSYDVDKTENGYDADIADMTDMADKTDMTDMTDKTDKTDKTDNGYDSDKISDEIRIKYIFITKIKAKIKARLFVVCKAWLYMYKNKKDKHVKLWSSEYKELWITEFEALIYEV